MTRGAGGEAADRGALGLLALASSEVADALGPDPRGWIEGAGALLRGPLDEAALLAACGAVARLRAGGEWDALLRALALDARAAGAARAAAGRRRSLWGVTPIIGLIHGAAAERRLGVEAETLVFTTYRVTSDFDVVLKAHAAAALAAGPVTSEAFHWLVLLWAVLSYDAFYYHYDRGLLPPTEFTGRFTMGIAREELALLRRAERLIFVTPYGADYRTRAPTLSASRWSFCAECPEVGAYCFCDEEAFEPYYRTVRAYATATLASGLALGQLPGARRLEHIVVDADAIAPRYPSVAGGRVRVLHVPNHPHFKGTRHLEAAMATLGDLPVDFALRGGLTNAEVMAAMGEADIVVDQLVSGNFGLTAIEAMAHGKPVVAYLADPSIALGGDDCPILNANPETIGAVLRRAIEDRAGLAALGRRSRAYVEEHYSIGALAGRLRALYRDRAGIELPDALPPATAPSRARPEVPAPR